MGVNIYHFFSEFPVFTFRPPITIIFNHFIAP